MKPVRTFLLIGALLLAFVLPARGEDIPPIVKNIHWLGHDTYRIAGDKVVYIDPFKIKKPDVADLILITHVHHDHCSVDDVRKLQGPPTVIVAPPDCAAKLSGVVKTVKPGDKLTAQGMVIEAVPAYNTDKQFHTRNKEWVGYIVAIGGTRVYHAGDTDYIPEMKTFKHIDVALLPVSGTYVMTADEAVRAALDIKPRVAIPMHYGTIVGTKADAERFARDLKDKVPVVILEQE
jgi:L-ascorbate metabolism protein UlaG (beta-lactamase superfamily)